MTATDQGRARRALGGSRQILRVVLRDPERIPERLSLMAAGRLAPAADEWAEATRKALPGEPVARIAERVRRQSAQVARVDGAIAGTPFFIALVPGYLAYLQEETRMSLRVAALYGRDPEDIRTAAEMLALRGVHPTPAVAEQFLVEVQAKALPDKPERRRPLRTWMRSAYLLLVFGGFLSAPENEAAEVDRSHSRLRATAGLVIGGLIWISTWVFPVSFMIVMAWGCESHTRELGRRVSAFYGGESTTAAEAIEAADQHEDSGHTLRSVLRSAALIASVAVPIAVIAIADRVKNTTGVTWLAAVGALVALSLVIAVSVFASRRQSLT